MKSLNVDNKNGISSSTCDDRIKAFGSNKKAESKLKSIWELLK